MSTFTTPSTDLAVFNWRSAAIVNEIRAGIRERQAALWISRIPTSSEGDSAQSASGNFALMQEKIEDMVPSFCDHGNGTADYSGLSAIPMWQITDHTAAHFLFEKMATGQRGWRRQVVKGTWATPDAGNPTNRAQAGDIIGTWVFEDLQRALKLLLWIPQQALWYTNGEDNSIDVGAIDDSVSSAKAAAETAFSGATPANNARFPSAGSYQEEHSNSPGGFIANLVRRYSYFGNSNGAGGNVMLPTLTRSANADLYFAAFAAIEYNTVDPVPATDFFGGDGVIESDPATVGAKQKTVSYDGSGTLWEKFGSLDLPPWCTDPASVGDYFSKGWAVTIGTVVVHAGDSFEWK